MNESMVKALRDRKAKGLDLSITIDHKPLGGAEAMDESEEDRMGMAPKGASNPNAKRDAEDIEEANEHHDKNMMPGAELINDKDLDAGLKANEETAGDIDNKVDSKLAPTQQNAVEEIMKKHGMWKGSFAARNKEGAEESAKAELPHKESGAEMGKKPMMKKPMGKY